MSTTFTQANLTAIEEAIVAKITSGSIGGGSFRVGNITIDEGTSLDALMKLYSWIKGVIDGTSGDITVATKLDGIDI